MSSSASPPPEAPSAPVGRARPQQRGPVVTAARAGSLREEAWGDLDFARWAALAAQVLQDQGSADGELGLHFVDSDFMAEMNREHMGETGPTDVLAFPLECAQAPPWPQPEGAERLLGDVVICPERAASQAVRHAGADHDGSLDDELALLVVHGVLHVLGHDHRDKQETSAMRALERRLIAAHHRRP